MNLMHVIRQVLTPGSPDHKAALSRLSEREAQLVNCLSMLDKPAIRDVRSATDEAAEFRVNVPSSN